MSVELEVISGGSSTPETTSIRPEEIKEGEEWAFDDMMAEKQRRHNLIQLFNRASETTEVTF